ncbi:hypothetical protein C84B14_14356 [Salinisphaera sp. C84B14]|jgi:imidazole glycerol phosphate synthase subunit HisF|uniref:hypothetical protein n=1 Tax=Salinisphaera sp. C84B14 TaxID=1304155 RepID=UPI003340F90B|tara:strand:- start:18 stop:494 length:477 start_codon:yes stop_codon:yes gene_type:complete
MSVTLQLPNISDRNLVFGVSETREIFLFFWPSRRSAIQGLAIKNEHRRYAQALLIVAIDASYTVGYVEILVNTLFRKMPRFNVGRFAAELGRRFTAHWWKHATRADLRDARIYDTVRASIALKQRGRFELLLNSLASDELDKSYVVVQSAPTTGIAWV